MPLTHGWSLVSPLIALALIGALALVLRWTFRQESDEAAETLAARASDAADADVGEATADTARAAATDPSPVGGGDAARTRRARPARDAADDYGLLGVVAVVATPDEAERVRAVLADAGIRATVAPGRQGRIRVLVFDDDLPRARRVVGWPL